MEPHVFDQLTSSPLAFRRKLRVDTDDGPRSFDSILDPWQREDFQALDAGWIDSTHRRDSLAIKRAYLERPRGHSKTTDLAVMVAWALLASRSALTGLGAAADKDQARLLRDAIRRITLLNPWLKAFLEVRLNTVRNPATGSELVIQSSDALGSYGQTPDFVIADELTHWSKRDLWDSLFSSAAKRRHCMFVVISNAGVGMGSSWQWRIREAARVSEGWHFHRVDGPKASWINAKLLDEQRAMLPPSAFRRLWLNEWIRGLGDALPAEDIEAAITQDGPMEGNEPGFVFAAGLDLGTKHDHSALTTLGTEIGSGKVQLADCQSWAPGPDGQVDLQAVEAAVLSRHRQYGYAMVGFDPSQAILMAQRLSEQGVPMVEVPFVGKQLDRMARDLLQTFRSRSLEMYRDERLISDLNRLSIVERRYGFKLEAISDELGHADRAIAMAIILPFMLEAAHDTPIEETQSGPVGFVA